MRRLGGGGVPKSLFELNYITVKSQERKGKNPLNIWRWCSEGAESWRGGVLEVANNPGGGNITISEKSPHKNRSFNILFSRH